MKRLLVIFGLLFALFSVARAGDFSWQVNCKELDQSERWHFWVGYVSTDDIPDSYIGYIGNGPGIYMDTFQAGQHDRVIEVLLPTDSDTVTLFAYPQDVSITISVDTDAPDCASLAPVISGQLTTITLPVNDGSLFRWEKLDANGHWGAVSGVVTPVQEENGLRFTRLVLGADNGDHDPNHYQIFAQG